VLQGGNQCLQFLLHTHIDIDRGIILYFIDRQKPPGILILIFFSGRLYFGGWSCAVFQELGHIFLIGLQFAAIQWIVRSIGRYFIIHITIVLIVDTVPVDTGGCF